MANVLKSDFSARSNLVAEQKITELAKAELRLATSRFKVFVGVVSFILVGVVIAYGLGKYTFWIIEGALFAALIWWVLLVAPQVIKMHHACSQLRAVEHGLQGEEAVAKILAEDRKSVV